MYTGFKQNLPIKQKLLTAFLAQLAAMLGMISLIYCADQQLLDSHTIGGIATGLLVVIAGLVMVMHRAIAIPYVSTVVRMEALAAGDVTSPIQFTSYRDCVGRMTTAMHSFQEAAQAKISADEQAESLRHMAAAERMRSDAERAATAEQQQLVVEGLTSGLARLAEGDLTCALEHPFAPEYEQLRGDFNRTVDQLRTVLNAIIANTNAIQSGTGEIAQASDDLSRRTEHQAASLEQTAAALDEITATVKLTAANSAQAQTVVSAAKQDAEHTSAVVHDAVAAMSRIEESSRQIGQILGVIDEMAFQTNLLALNAGVEAARAGDAGRGFAVVASEVRALAQRSAEASKEIKALVFASDEQVKAGVDLVGEAGKALSRIIRQVTEINKLVTDIAGSANEQAAGLVQVNTAVNQMDQVTQQNAAMVEQATAAAHSLTQETNELGQLTARFQVGASSTKIPNVAATSLSPLTGCGKRAFQTGFDTIQCRL